MPLWNQKRTFNLIDLEITHSCSHDHTGSLRDLLQSHLLRPKHNNHSLELTTIGVQCYPSLLPRTSWPIRSPSQQPIGDQTPPHYKHTPSHPYDSRTSTSSMGSQNRRLRFPNLIPLYKNSNPTSGSLTSTLSSCNKVTSRPYRIHFSDPAKFTHMTPA